MYHINISTVLYSAGTHIHTMGRALIPSSPSPLSNIIIQKIDSIPR